MDFDTARAAIPHVTGQKERLDGSPVIRKSILLRNLLQRARSERNWRDLLFLSIIAAAMQSTG